MEILTAWLGLLGRRVRGVLLLVWVVDLYNARLALAPKRVHRDGGG